ncbi:MAG: aminotransferase class V-fold PLP-dependent enzyme [Ignavibacteria bacterium]|nr:aminotransferase class V-fold PLP-dependent enzyme [Ignavibacteria bacterium]
MKNYDKSEFDNLSCISDARKLFPSVDTCVYLDSAHYAPYSIETNRRLKEYIDKFTFTNDNLSIFNNEKLSSVRELASRLINSDKSEIIITGCTTHGLNIFANGIKLNKDDCAAYADSEFPSIVYAWMNQEKLNGIRNIKIPSRNGVIKTDDIEKVLSENNVKVLTISSVEFLGFRNNLEEIRGICTERGVYLVIDGIQSIGVVPFDVKKLNPDFLAAGSQKWMMSPAGIGFSYIPERMRSIINPTYVATASVKYNFDNFLDYNLEFNDDGSAYENSTPNTLGMIGLESSLELFLKIGVENIFKHILHLMDLFSEGLAKTNFINESDMSPEHRSNIMIFSHKDKTKNAYIQKDLEKENVFIALREGFLRVSPHLFNNEGDIEKLLLKLGKY